MRSGFRLIASWQLSGIAIWVHICVSSAYGRLLGFDAYAWRVFKGWVDCNVEHRVMEFVLCMAVKLQIYGQLFWVALQSQKEIKNSVEEMSFLVSVTWSSVMVCEHSPSPLKKGSCCPSRHESSLMSTTLWEDLCCWARVLHGCGLVLLSRWPPMLLHMALFPCVTFPTVFELKKKEWFFFAIGIDINIKRRHR